mmetsp:Transcript_1866/g.5432  ORF Transcript_1866/g.5432 Transcript_1866/m.5432 type:complete len:209 (+) Transcript_1866:802-1428(+)
MAVVVPELQLGEVLMQMDQEGLHLAQRGQLLPVRAKQLRDEAAAAWGVDVEACASDAPLVRPFFPAHDRKHLVFVYAARPVDVCHAEQRLQILHPNAHELQEEQVLWEGDPVVAVAVYNASQIRRLRVLWGGGFSVKAASSDSINRVDRHNRSHQVCFCHVLFFSVLHRGEVIKDLLCVAVGPQPLLILEEGECLQFLRNELPPAAAA